MIKIIDHQTVTDIIITTNIPTMLNYDIYSLIFKILPISGKRSLIRTNKFNNKLSIHMIQAELEFSNMVNGTSFFSRNGYHIIEQFSYNPLFKFTVELLYDGYDIPDRYIITENKMLYQFPMIYKMLAMRGNLRMIKKLLRINPKGFNVNEEYIMRGAAKTGNIDILNWICDQTSNRESVVTNSAIKAGQMETLHWLIKHEFGISGDSTYYAAGNAHTDILQFLINDVGKPGDMRLAARNGHIDLIKNMYLTHPASLNGIIYDAILSGNLDLVEFLYRNVQ